MAMMPESALDFMSRQVARVREIRPRKRIVFPEGCDPRVLEAPLQGTDQLLVQVDLADDARFSGAEGR